MSSLVYNFVSSCPRRAFRTPTAGLKRAKVAVYSQDISSQGATTPRASPISDIDEDREVMHTSFLKAFEGAQPERAHIPGMMEFAGAVSC